MKLPKGAGLGGRKIFRTMAQKPPVEIPGENMLRIMAGLSRAIAGWEVIGNCLSRYVLDHRASPGPEMFSINQMFLGINLPWEPLGCTQPLGVPWNQDCIFLLPFPFWGG